MVMDWRTGGGAQALRAEPASRLEGHVHLQPRVRLRPHRPVQALARGGEGAALGFAPKGELSEKGNCHAPIPRRWPEPCCPHASTYGVALLR